MMDQNRSLVSFMPIAAAVLGLGFVLNACGESDAGGEGGSGPGGSATSGDATTGPSTGSGAGPGTSGTAGAGSTSSTSTSGVGAGPATGTGAGGHGTVECDEPGGTVPPLKLTEVARGFTRPLFVTSEPADPSRLYVVEQDGTIRLIKDGVLQSTAFLDISELVRGYRNSGDEVGLLGLAFHPDYATNGRFFVYFNTRRGTQTLQEYRRSSTNPDQADPQAQKEFFSIETLVGNHNGGMLAFGPDGMLYVGIGDGGGTSDNPDANNNGQNINVKYGKILRIDVDNHPTPPPGNLTGGDPDIWDYGLRNPWRFSFDRCKGDLYIGDVGGRLFEEINIEPRGEGNRNYGWSVTEGTQCLKPEQSPGCDSPTITPPVEGYNHNLGDGSITGGYVYRGSKIPALRGAYLYGDFESNRVWTLTWKDNRVVSKSNLSQDLQSETLLEGLASFGEDAAGELYIVDYGGRIYRIDPE